MAFHAAQFRAELIVCDNLDALGYILWRDGEKVERTQGAMHPHHRGYTHLQMEVACLETHHPVENL